MMRLLIWQVGVWFFAAVLWRTGYWREIAPIATLLGAALWAVGGGYWVARGRTGTPRDLRDTPAHRAAAIDQMLRAIEERKKREAAP